MKLEKTLIEMVGHFTPSRAAEWLRYLFSSFETDVEPIAVDTTKNESAYFAEARRLGWVARLPETNSTEAANKPIVVVAVRMKGDLTERTSRLVQFAFAKKAIQNAIARAGRGIHGLPTQGLFFFYDADGYFRISLVSGEADGRKLKYNSAKRQSFYVDPTAANNILRRRLGDQITTFAELKNAFSVEHLTKEFYGRLFEWYTWALAPRTGVTFPNDLADEKDDRKYNHEAIIRLITRLMFTWFIRQKIPALQEFFDRDSLDETLKGNRGKGRFNPDSMEDDNYYRCILQNLFFATFNCPQTGKGKLLRRWINADLDERGDGRGLSDDFNVTTVYRYRNEFKDPDAFLERMRGVPFLNCALFDCLDKAERKQDGGRKLYFDGFSTKIKRQAHVPNGLFFKEGRGIIDLFNGYEFTINENSADDADVALDPELLGKVFENLLGAFNPETQETARKATGSFYTPREIVDYMVEESLKNYLKGKLGDDVKDIDVKLDDLFDRTRAAEGERTMFSRKEEETLLNALYDCKVLDPACGSGAFPMGVLHCMVRLLARLDPDSVSIRERLNARYRADKDSVDPTETAADRRERLAELEKYLDEGHHYPDYARKLYLIENCIYGVDIQPIATQISKLRFFISLLCDQFRTSFNGEENNYGLLALPNLEAKFVCANTLISLPEASVELDLTTRGVAEARERLKINRHRIFGARSTGTKEKYKKRDLEIRDEIRESVVCGLAKPDENKIAEWREAIKKAENRRKSVAEPDWAMKEVIVPQQDGLGLEGFDDGPKVSAKRIVRIDRNAEARDTIDREIDFNKQQIAKEMSKAERSNVSAAQNYAALVAGWDPFDQNASSKFFDPEWMFNVTDGFDVVIGNPPYVKLETIKDQSRILEEEGYEVFSKRSDLYCLFTERGFDLLCRDGVISYIMSNKWLQAEYGRSLRGYFLKNRLCSLIDFGDNELFEGATVYPCIFVAGNDKPQEDVDVTVMKYYKSETFVVDMANWKRKFPVSKLSQDTWVLSLDAISILEKIGERCTTLEEYVGGEAYYGIKPGATEAFIIDADTATDLIKQHSSSKKILVPILRGRDMRRWYSPFTGWFMIGTFPALSIDIDKYPAIKRHLLAYGKKKLEQSGEKGSRKKTSNKWFETQDQIAYHRLFQGPKIMYQKFQVAPCFIYDESGLYCNDSMWIIPTKDKALVGLLNSKMGWWLISRYCTQIQNGYQLIWEYFRKIPVPKRLSAELGKVTELVIAARKKDSNADTSALESEIDQFVYKLYGLTDDEIAIVEGRNENKQEPQGETARRPAASSRRRRQATIPPTPAPTDDEVLE